MLKTILKTLFMGWIAKKFAGRSTRDSSAYRR